jgi:hypothetical protein
MAKGDQRHHPRYRVYAAIERHVDDEMLCLTVRDLSRGGLWVFAGEHVRPTFPIGSSHRLLLLDVADENNPQAEATAEVMRHDPGGLAMRWREGDSLAAVEQLLGKLRKRP